MSAQNITTVNITPAGAVVANVLYGGKSAGTGDVTGPASSTDNALARFDGAGGKTIQNSGVTLADGVTGVVVVSGGGLTLAYAAKTANYTVLATDYVIECTSNSFTITLLTAVGIAGQTFIIKNSGTGIITIATTSSQTIDGYASSAITLPQYTSLSVVSNGANWIIV